MPGSESMIDFRHPSATTAPRATTARSIGVIAAQKSSPPKPMNSSSSAAAITRRTSGVAAAASASVKSSGMAFGLVSRAEALMT